MTATSTTSAAPVAPSASVATTTAMAPSAAMTALTATALSNAAAARALATPLRMAELEATLSTLVAETLRLRQMIHGVQADVVGDDVDHLHLLQSSLRLPVPTSTTTTTAVAAAATNASANTNTNTTMQMTNKQAPLPSSQQQQQQQQQQQHGAPEARVLFQPQVTQHLIAQQQQHLQTQMQLQLQQQQQQQQQQQSALYQQQRQHMLGNGLGSLQLSQQRVSSSSVVGSARWRQDAQAVELAHEQQHAASAASHHIAGDAALRRRRSALSSATDDESEENASTTLGAGPRRLQQVKFTSIESNLYIYKSTRRIHERFCYFVCRRFLRRASRLFAIVSM